MVHPLPAGTFGIVPEPGLAAWRCAWQPGGSSAAAGLAVINAKGNLGGFVAQNVVPWIKDRTGSTLAPMLFLAFAGLMIFVVQGLLGRTSRAAVPAE